MVCEINEMNKKKYYYYIIKKKKYKKKHIHTHTTYKFSFKCWPNGAERNRMAGVISSEKKWQNDARTLIFFFEGVCKHSRTYCVRFCASKINHYKMRFNK